MATGRCAGEGCGKTGPEKAMLRHIRECPKWQAVYAEDPARALDPVAEYVRWQSEDQAADRDARRQEAVTRTDGQRAAMHKRFSRSTDIDI